MARGPAKPKKPKKLTKEELMRMGTTKSGKNVYKNKATEKAAKKRGGKATSASKRYLNQK